MNRKKYFFFSFLSAVSKTILLAALIVGLTSCESVFGSLSIPNSANCSVVSESCLADEACHPQRQVCVPALALYRATPSLASSSGGTPITLYGERFLPGLTVEFDGQTIPNVTVKSQTELSFPLPASAQGHFLVPITVRNPTGQSIRQDSLFRYYAETLQLVPSSVSIQSSANDAIAAELTGDGVPDVLVASSSESLVSLFPGKKDASFLSPSVSGAGMNPYRVNLLLPFSLPTDSYPSIIVAWNDRVQRLSGTGGGNFSKQQSATLPTQVTAMISCNTGRTDAQTLFVSTKFSLELHSVALRFDGTFDAPVRIAQGVTVDSLGCADLDGDGKEELVSSDAGAELSVWWTNKPGGVTQQRIPTTGTCTQNELTTADIDQDGDIDVVLSCTQGLLRLQNQQGNLVPLPIIASASPLGRGILATDLSGDGWPELVYIDRGQKRILATQADRQGGYLPPVVLHTDAGQSWLGAQRLLLADFNLDAKPDVFYSGLSNGTSFLVMLNQSK